MKIFKMTRGFFLKSSSSSKIMQNEVPRVTLWSLTLNSHRIETKVRAKLKVLSKQNKHNGEFN